MIDVEILPQPNFVGKRTSSGIPFEEIGQFFTDRLSLAIFWSCINATDRSKGCKFCELSEEPYYEPCELDDILEVFEFCQNDTSLNMNHVLISGGTPKKSDWPLVPELIKRIRESNNTIPIYHMSEPNLSLREIELLYNSGLNEIAFNIEIFDREIAMQLMPQKGYIPLSKYEDSLKSAVKLWGRNGSVRSILIVGLEPEKNTLEGVEYLCNLGVMPILSPFRPVPGTKLQNWSPCDGQQLFEIWKQAQSICEKYNQTLGPQCKFCINNTIAMPINEKY